MNDKELAFKKELEALINRYGLEQGSDTPDFILTDYLIGCIGTFNRTLEAREQWYSRPLARTKPASIDVEKELRTLQSIESAKQIDRKFMTGENPRTINQFNPPNMFERSPYPPTH